MTAIYQLLTGITHRPICNRPITVKDKKIIHAVFHSTDQGCKGFLNREDVKVAIVALFGYKPSKYEVNEMMVKGSEQEDGQRGICVEKFTDMMSTKMAAIDEDEEVRGMFMAFDVHCHGFLTLEDLKRVISQVAPHISCPVVEMAFREADRDGDGRVSYKDFEFLMKYNTDD